MGLQTGRRINVYVEKLVVYTPVPTLGKYK